MLSAYLMAPWAFDSFVLLEGFEAVLYEPSLVWASHAVSLVDFEAPLFWGRLLLWVSCISISHRFIYN